MSDLPNTGKMFVYGTLTNPEMTEHRFPCEHVGEAVARGITKVGNNVIPADDSSTVDGEVFEVHNFKPIDAFEVGAGYDRFEAETNEGETVYLYSTAGRVSAVRTYDGRREVEDDFSDVVVSIL